MIRGRALAVASALVGLAAVTALALIEAATPFPPGGDPGHILALSHAFTGNPTEGDLAYAPALPLAFAGLRALFGDDATALLGAIKAFGLALFLAQASGVAALASALALPGSERRAAAWGFAAGCVNPLAWFQILWGGYPQFLAVACGAGGLALLARAARSERTRTRARLAATAGALFALAAATHTYSAVFFAVAALALLVSRARLDRAWRAPLAAGATAGGVAAALALPALPTYLRIASDVRTGGGESSYLAALLDAGHAIRVRWEVALLAGLVVLVALAGARRRPWPRDASILLVSLGVGLAALFAVTPPLLVTRLADFLAVAVLAVVAARLAAIETGKEDPRRAAAVLLAGLFLVTALDVRDTHPRYATLDGNDVEAMRAVAELPPGRVLVASPWPNADGWWLEGLAGKPALIGDLLKWYALEAEAERSVAARTLVAGTAALDGGALVLVEGAPATTHGSPSLWVRDVAEFYPILEHDVALSAAVVRAGTRDVTWLPAGHRNVTLELDRDARALVTRGDAGPLRVERASRGTEAGVELDFRFDLAPGEPGEVARARIGLAAPPGVVFHRAFREDERLVIDAEFVWERLARRVIVDVDAPGAWRASFSPVGPYGASVVNVTFEGDGHRALEVAIDLSVEGARPREWTLVGERELLAAWDVKYAYVRGPLASDRARFDGDPAFELAWTRGDVALYRVVDAP